MFLELYYFVFLYKCFNWKIVIVAGKKNKKNLCRDIRLINFQKYGALYQLLKQ